MVGSSSSATVPAWPARSNGSPRRWSRHAPPRADLRRDRRRAPRRLRRGRRQGGTVRVAGGSGEPRAGEAGQRGACADGARNDRLHPPRRRVRPSEWAIHRPDDRGTIGPAIALGGRRDAVFLAGRADRRPAGGRRRRGERAARLQRHRPQARGWRDRGDLGERPDGAGAEPVPRREVVPGAGGLS